MASPSAAARLAPVAACLLLVACSGESTGDGSSSLSIAPCADDPMLDCGTLDVPLVHGSTDPRRMLVDVVLLPGTGAGPHESLLVNPGGPGGSGTEMVRAFAALELLPAALRERYGVVGFDPRGIGTSQRIDCERLGLADPLTTPSDRASLEAFAAEATATGDACFAEYGDVLQHLGSNAVVQDMEALRTMLGAPKLDFIGYSYGTRLAALYLQRYPGTSGRIVLDASLLPGGETAPLLADTAATQQGNLDALLSACTTMALEDCDAGNLDPAGLNAALDTRLQELIDADDEEALEPFVSLLTTSVESPELGEGLLIPALVDYVRTDDLELLVTIARIVDGTQGDVAVEESVTVQRAVICADDPTRPDIDDLAATLDGLEEISDIFARLGIAAATSCIGWPDSIDPVGPIATSAAPVSLVIGGTTDAQTPIRWAPIMAEAIGGAYLASNHDGHTVVFSDKSRCVDDVALAFLLDGTLPAEASCAADARSGRESRPSTNRSGHCTRHCTRHCARRCWRARSSRPTPGISTSAGRSRAAATWSSARRPTPSAPSWRGPTARGARRAPPGWASTSRAPGARARCSSRPGKEAWTAPASASPCDTTIGARWSCSRSTCRGTSSCRPRAATTAVTTTHGPMTSSAAPRCSIATR